MSLRDWIADTNTAPTQETLQQALDAALGRGHERLLRIVPASWLVRRERHPRRMPSDFKREKPIADKAGCARKVLKEGCCRACGGTNLPLNRAHIVPASQGGPWVPENIIPLGGSGSIGCHGIQHSHWRSENCRGIVTTYEELIAQIHLRPDEAELAIDLKGLAWVVARYPSVLELLEVIDG